MRENNGANRLRAEFILLRIELYGGHVTLAEFYRPIRKIAYANGQAWREIRAALIQGEVPLCEIADVLGAIHPQGCACWSCIGALRGAILRHREKLNGRAF